jgi:hypothetical protein
VFNFDQFFAILHVDNNSNVFDYSPRQNPELRLGVLFLALPNAGKPSFRSRVPGSYPMRQSCSFMRSGQARSSDLATAMITRTDDSKGVTAESFVPIQNAAMEIAKFLNLPSLTFVVGLAQQKPDTAAHIELARCGSEVLVEVSRDVLNYDDAVLATLPSK